MVRGRMSPVAIAKSSFLKNRLIIRSKRFAQHFHAHEPASRQRMRLADEETAKCEEWWMDSDFQARFPYVILGRDWKDHHRLPRLFAKVRKAEHSSTLSPATFLHEASHSDNHDVNDDDDVSESGPSEPGRMRRCLRTRGC